MNHAKLTSCTRRAHKLPMTGKKTGKRTEARRVSGLVAMTGVLALGGCVNLEAPDEPIVIELNINITQEVIYRLADDAENTLDENADIF